MIDKNNCHTHSRRRNKAVSGVLLIIIGLALLAFNFGWLNPQLRSVIISWPMLFVLFGIISLFRMRMLPSLVWFMLGLFFLIPRLLRAYPELFPFDGSDFVAVYWPLLLILIGVIIVLKFAFRSNSHNDSGKHVRSSNWRFERNVEGVDGQINRRVVFAGSESVFLDPVFRGGGLSAIFGGIELDLRRTKLPDGDTYLDVECVFGGISLDVPDDWLVVSEVESVLGGFTDKRIPLTNIDDSRRLIIRGDVVFGGCEVK